MKYAMKNILFRMWRFLGRYRTQAVIFTVIGCLAVLSVITFGAIYVVAQPASTSSERLTIKTPNLGRHFQQFGREGSILIYDSKNNRFYEHNPQRNATA
jgi:beta-lactamase class D